MNTHYSTPASAASAGIPPVIDIPKSRLAWRIGLVLLGTVALAGVCFIAFIAYIAFVSGVQFG